MQTLVIASRPECIEEARSWAADGARGAGLPAAAVEELELALTEALANVIEHGYSGDAGQRIELSLAAEGGAVRLTVRDWGRDFDPAGYSPRNLDEPGEGGYGVYLMEQLMDEVTREPQPGGGNLLTLTKSRTKDGTHG